MQRCCEPFNGASPLLIKSPDALSARANCAGRRSKNTRCRSSKARSRMRGFANERSRQWHGPSFWPRCHCEQVNVFLAIYGSPNAQVRTKPRASSKLSLSCRLSRFGLRRKSVLAADICPRGATTSKSAAWPRIKARRSAAALQLDDLDPLCEALPRSLLLGCADAGRFGHRYGLAHSHLRHVGAHHFAGDAGMRHGGGVVSRIVLGVV